MDKKNNASVVRHMTISFAVVVGAFIAASLFSLDVSGRLKNSLDSVIDDAMPVTNTSSELTLSLLTTDKALTSFIANQNPALITRYQQEFDLGHQQFRQHIEQLTQLTHAELSSPAENPTEADVQTADIQTIDSAQLTALSGIEQRYFTLAKATFSRYEQILKGRLNLNQAVHTFQNKKLELQYGLKALIDNGNNDVLKLTSDSFFNSLREVDNTTSEALTTKDIASIEAAIKKNKMNVVRLDYSFKALAAQEPILSERYGTLFQGFLTDAGRKDGVLQQHDDFTRSELAVDQDIATLATLMNNALVLLNTLRQQSAEHVTELAAQANSNYTRGFWFSVTVSTIVALLAALTGWFLARSVRKPVHAILQTLRDIESGNMTSRINTKSNNEFGLIANHINTMAARLHDILEQIGHASTQLSHVTLLNQTNTTTAQSAVESQREQTTSVATAMAEMEHSVKEIARSVNHTLDQVLMLEQTVTQSDRLVQDNIATSQQLSSRLTNTSSEVKTVAQMSERIGSILDVIRSIADQTNLLALNAAIEAARAGDMGRGFAVVADEVRVLAKRTTDSTGQIEKMIAELQNSTHTALSNMDNCLNDMSLSVNQTSQTGDAMKIILDGLGQISDMNAQIANAATEQEATSTDIARNLEEISRLADQNFHSIEKIAENSAQLDTLATSQERLVKQFTL